MAFENTCFIKAKKPIGREFATNELAPMFRRRFTLGNFERAQLRVCGLGFGYFWLNGQPVSEDRLNAPFSDYNKTLWYHTYDVTALLKNGENVAAVWCGNGWYNEHFPTSWDFDAAPWRDAPKFILELVVDGKIVLTGDEQWKCRVDGPVVFNALRSGEHFDARRHDADWTALDYDDSAWEFAVTDDTPPTGVFRACPCEPVRECAVYPARLLGVNSLGRRVYDIGQNISGYARLTFAGACGQQLTLRYAEQVNDDLTLQLNNMTLHYPASDFQTDRFICSGQTLTWSPQFCYHGFRYIEVEGLDEDDAPTLSGVFVHQDVELRTEFRCSDEFLNKLFRAGQFSVYSNMFYLLSDCPTREKLGWTNDAQSSAEQVLTDFKAERVLGKWLQDVYDAMRADGALPGIIPTAGWGFDWGNGPVSEGLLFELPYRLYLHTGDKQPLLRSRAYFDRYFAYIDGRTDADGFVRFGLDDWARPQFETPQDVDLVPLELINALLVREFYRIAALAARLDGADDGRYLARGEQLKQLVRRHYVDANGRCTSRRQTSVAMLIYYDICDDNAPLAAQLKELVEQHGFRHDCGMVGMRRLFYALNKVGLQEYAYRILTSSGMPSYREWFEQDATTLWEYWPWQRRTDSKNHHMYSDFMSWMVKTILGVECAEPGFARVKIAPYFFEQLDHAEGHCETVAGDVRVCWKREPDGVKLHFEIPQGMTACYGGKELGAGVYDFTV